MRSSFDRPRGWRHNQGMARKPVIDWDGKHLPPGLKRVPPGRYVLEPANGDDALTPVEAEGIEKALDDLDAGRGKSLAEVVDSIRRKARRR